MRQSARVILISKERKLVLIERYKPETGTYYVTIGGGIEENETSQEAAIRELREETGSDVENLKFTFHFDDQERLNSVDFYLAYETKRSTPTGTEWTKYNTQTNQYKIKEVSLDEAKNLPIKPDILKDKILKVLEEELNVLY